MPKLRMSQKRAETIAQSLSEGSTQVEACVKAGISRKRAMKKGYIICKKPEVFAELLRLGAIVPDGELGDAAKAVLVHKLSEHGSINNRELAPFLQMSLQAGKKIGAGSVQAVPQNVQNIQINFNPVELELMKQVLAQIQAENPGKEIVIEGLTRPQLPQSGEIARVISGANQGELGRNVENNGAEVDDGLTGT